jgi:maltooligosyltrehalose trehalohydrolase
MPRRPWIPGPPSFADIMPTRFIYRESATKLLRRLPVGADVQADGRVHFRVWALSRQSVAVVLEGAPGYRSGSRALAVPLAPEGAGYFSGEVPEAGAGSLYRFRLGDESYADPASRFQPEGPFGPSQVIDPDTFAWTDRHWRGPALDGNVVYELHVGTFTPEGTWAAASEELPRLAELGVTVLELMPVNEFPGRFGWGYDGVNLFAPTRLYGRPDDLRGFIDRAHALGLAVILDVVYNHLGPDGNFLPQFSSDYFTTRYNTDWGTPLNFDGENSGPVREFVLANVSLWIAEFHFDGLRIDATQNIYDRSSEHILAAITRQARAAGQGRTILVVGENEEQRVQLVRPLGEGGCGFDMLWNDDYHHAARVAATGRSEGYYRDYRGTPQELVSAAKHGFLYQGQFNTRQGKRRGTPAFGIHPATFMNFLQNHDQVGNSAAGIRLHQQTNPGRYRALTALTLLGPGTPMLFQGQEFAASTPFFFFSDQKPEIAEQMHQTRKEFLALFRSLATPQMQERFARPDDPATFARSKLDPAERAGVKPPHSEALALHRDLLRLRREQAVFRVQRPGRVDGAVLGAEAFVLRFFGEHGDDRLLVVNLGPDLYFEPVAEPLLAPPAGTIWHLLWSSEDPAYGGAGTPALGSKEPEWCILSHATVAMMPLTEPAIDV